MKKLLSILIILVLAAVGYLLCDVVLTLTEDAPSDPSTSATEDTQDTPAAESTGGSTQDTQPSDPTGTEADSTESTDETIDLSEYDPYRFLTEVNHSGKIEPPSGETPLPPGTLPDVSRIPQPDQSLVGQTVQFVLSSQSDCVFTFTRDSQEDKECLSLYLPAKRIPMLLRLETHLGSGEALAAALQQQTVLEGKILSITNISPVEEIYARKACYAVRKMGEAIFRAVGDSSPDSAVYLYIGRTGEDLPTAANRVPQSFLSGGIQPFLSGGIQSHLSDEWLGHYEVFQRILRRFGLEE